MDLIVRGGTLVTAAGISKADLGISQGRIAQIGGAMPAAAAEVDATDLLVLPGGIDVHTHLDAPNGDLLAADDFRSGGIAAACGGTTTHIDFCAQLPGQTLAAALDAWHAKADGKAAIDYGFHIIVVEMNDGVRAELGALPEQGITSFKLFMAYKGQSQIDDLTMLETLEQARATGAVVMVHAENGDAAYFLQQRFLAAGQTAPKYHAASRPPRTESEATARAIALAEIVGAPLYVVHMTCRDSVEELLRGRARGAPVWGETCTSYLYTTQDDLDRPGFEGAKYVFTPPPRTAADHGVLWNALADGTLSALSSDHCPWNFAGAKDRGRDDFTQIPNGGPGIEERMIMGWQGVARGLLSPERFVEITATAPARLFGLYPRKGTIAVGSDADLVLWDPEARITMTQSALHHGIDYTLYEGQPVQGLPRHVLLRGAVIVRDRAYVGTPGSGQFIRRAKFNQPLA